MSTETLYAHSIAEIHLFLMATPCEECGRGPLVARERPLLPAEGEFYAACRACDHQRQYTFALPPDAPADDPDDLYPVINPTNHPSRILDVGQWIVLFGIVLEAASKEPAKIETRRLEYEAAQCLAEALKFYEDNDLPPESAVRCPSTRARLRDHPEQFSKDHLTAMRAKLPAISAVARQAGAKDPEHPRRRPWWRFWGSP